MGTLCKYRQVGSNVQGELLNIKKIDFYQNNNNNNKHGKNGISLEEII